MCYFLRTFQFQNIYFFFVIGKMGEFHHTKCVKTWNNIYEAQKWLPIALESFFGSGIRFRFIELVIGAFRYVPLCCRFIEFALAVRTRYVVGCITWRRWRQIRQFPTFGQMLLHFLRTANRLNEFLVLASPVGFLLQFWLFLQRTGPRGSFNVHLRFGALRENGISIYFSLASPHADFNTHLDPVFCCIENFAFLRCRFLANDLMFLDSIVVEKSIADATGRAIFRWRGWLFPWLWRNKIQMKKKVLSAINGGSLRYLSLSLRPIVSWHCCVTTMSSDSSIAFSSLVAQLPNGSSFRRK